MQTTELAIWYAIYAGGFIVLAMVILQLRVWNARQDRIWTEVKAIIQGENDGEN